MSDESHNQPSHAIGAAVNQIASDNSSGATEILRRAGAVFSLLSAWHREQSPGSVEDAQRAVIETCIALARAQPDMSPILRLASAAVSAALLAVDARQALDAAETAAIRFVDNSASQARAAALHASTIICAGTSVLTHSRSSTVVEAFFEARRAGRDFSVVATESRPVLEGRALAEALAHEGIPVTLIADSAASLVMDQVDLIFVGADKVTPQYLVNKIGTRMIALAGRERGLRVYAVCDTSKFISKDYFDSPARGERTANELWPDAPPGVRVVNRYFEQTPLTYLTGVITEDGFLSSREAARRAEGASLDRVLEDALERYLKNADAEY